MIRQTVEPWSNSSINIVLENKLWPEILVISTNKTPFIECIIHHKPNEKQLHLINGHKCSPCSINGFTTDSSHFEAQHASTPSRRGKQRDQRGAPGRNHAQGFEHGAIDIAMGHWAINKYGESDDQS